MSQRKSRQDRDAFELSLNLALGKNQEMIKSAVLPELNAKHAKRSTTSIGIKNRIISINIKAWDRAALRASLNGCLNSIILAKEIMEV